MNQGLLPVVSRDTRLALVASFEQNENYSRDAIGRMVEENPMIADFILQFATMDPSSQRRVTETAVLVYELLRNQAEADSLSLSMSEK